MALHVEGCHRPPDVHRLDDLGFGQGWPRPLIRPKVHSPRFRSKLGLVECLEQRSRIVGCE